MRASSSGGSYGNYANVWCKNETDSLIKENKKKKQLFFPIVVSEDLARGGITNKVRTNLRTLKSNFLSLFGSNQ